MDPLSQIMLLVLGTVFSVALLLLWLRFLMQLADVDYYSPFSQFIAKVTTPLVKPFQSILPTIGRADLAPIALIFIIKLLQIGIMAQLANQAFTPGLLVVNAVFALLLSATTFFFWLILGTVILSWVSAASGGVNPALVPLFEIAEIVLAPCRRIMPAMGGFDLSPIVAFLGIQIIEILLKSAYPSAIGLLAGA